MDKFLKQMHHFTSKGLY